MAKGSQPSRRNGNGLKLGQPPCSPATAHVKSRTGPQGPLPFSKTDDRRENQVAHLAGNEPFRLIHIGSCFIHTIRRIIVRMKTTASFTSTISPELIAWVDKRARSQKRTRRAILEEALKGYQRDAMKNVLKSGFERAALDTDMFELVEWGMDDYKRLVSRT